jgi:hypothetical protein
MLATFALTKAVCLLGEFLQLLLDF